MNSKEYEVKIKSEFIYLCSCWGMVKFTETIIKDVIEQSHNKVNEDIKNAIIKEFGMLFVFWITRELTSWLKDKDIIRLYYRYLIGFYSAGCGFNDQDREAIKRYYDISETPAEAKEFGKRICKVCNILEDLSTEILINSGQSNWIKGILETAKRIIDSPLPKIENEIKDFKQ